ncbi:hypothetical protein B0H13DRAFT_2057169, partial [Mycena leptocephala]
MSRVDPEKLSPPAPRSLLAGTAPASVLPGPHRFRLHRRLPHPPHARTSLFVTEESAASARVLCGRGGAGCRFALHAPCFAPSSCERRRRAARFCGCGHGSFFPSRTLAPLRVVEESAASLRVRPWIVWCDGGSRFACLPLARASFRSPRLRCPRTHHYHLLRHRLHPCRTARGDSAVGARMGPNSL